jgi:hypothetical protein
LIPNLVSVLQGLLNSRMAMIIIFFVNRLVLELKCLPS